MAMVKKQTFKITKVTDWENADDISTIISEKHNASNEVTSFKNLFIETHESGDMDGADWIDPNDAKVCHVVRYWTQSGWDSYQSLKNDIVDTMGDSSDLTYEETVEDVNLTEAEATTALENLVPEGALGEPTE